MSLHQKRDKLINTVQAGTPMTVTGLRAVGDGLAAALFHLTGTGSVERYSRGEETTTDLNKDYLPRLPAGEPFKPIDFY